MKTNATMNAMKNLFGFIILVELGMSEPSAPCRFSLQNVRPVVDLKVRLSFLSMGKIIAVASFLAISNVAFAQIDRITGKSFATRSEVVARHGMVCTSVPAATQVGLEILKRGGSAVDAAIAANATLGLMEPVSNGIGGDLFAIVYSARENKLYGINGSGRSPLGLSYEQMKTELAKLKIGQGHALKPLHWDEFLKVLERAGFRAREMITSRNTVLYSYALWLIGRIDLREDGTEHRCGKHARIRVVTRAMIAREHA